MDIKFPAVIIVFLSAHVSPFTALSKSLVSDLKCSYILQNNQIQGG